jgi:2,3-bisphosphoglycerate-independent phosphoglycerate mutase
MADYPVRELGDKTPLQVANTPNMDSIASAGIVGMVKTIPEGMPPGSDVANMSVLGYNPEKYYTGRAPLEAVSMGISMKPDEIAFRCNLVTIEDGVMKDYSSGHISSQEAKELIDTINLKLGDECITFYPGVGYRHLMIWDTKGKEISVKCRPPHDITGKNIHEFLPEGVGAELLQKLMFASQEILVTHKVNQERIKENKNPANMIWLWGYGKPCILPKFKDRFGLTGGVISAVDLVKGIGISAGLKVIEVPGITGYYDTNYTGKAEYALNALDNNNIDFMFIHIEAPDEAGHNGDVFAKIKAIEDIDNKVIGTILNNIHRFDNNVRILVLPDHETPVYVKTHTNGAVPFVMYGSGIEQDNIDEYNEVSAKDTKLMFDYGWQLMEYFLTDIPTTKG